MGFMDKLKNILKTDVDKNYAHAKMLDGYIPIFSQFGDSIYASDVVQTCIDVIATECSKLRPKHIRTDNNDIQSIVNGSINRLFKFGPNELMTTRDFLEKTIWLLYLNYNVFIFPTYDIIMKNGVFVRREYTGFYPLNPTQVDFLQDPSGKLHVKLTFNLGQNYTVPYADLIHLRKKFSVNEVMGGGRDGQPDNEAILKVLNINDSVLQGIEKSVKSSLAIRGIIKINTMLDDESQKEERKKFEDAIKKSETGILPMDLKGEYQDIKVDPKLVDKETLDFLDDKILKFFGVSRPILNGDFTDDQYQAFYERTLESLIISLGQAFSKTLFTRSQLEHGNEIIFYERDMMYLNTKSKLELIKTAGEQGLLKDNQKLRILGYGPVEGGDRVTQSLNYINREIIDQYQLKNGSRKPGEGEGR